MNPAAYRSKLVSRLTLIKKRFIRPIAVLVIAFFVNAELCSFGVAFAQTNTPEQSKARRLALFVLPKTKKDETTAMFVKALLRGVTDRLVSVGVERAPTSPVEDPGAIAIVRAKVEEGRRALNAQKWEDALNAYSTAQKELDKCLAIAGSALVARTYKGLGISLIAMKRLEEATAAVKRSLLAYPGQKAAEYAYNLESRNLFQTTQREIEESPSGLLSITTSPPGAEVYVDFVSRDFSPTKVSGIPAGEHVVTIFKDGYQAWSKFVTVLGGPEEKLNVELIPTATSKALEDALTAAARTIEKGRPGQSEMARLAEVAIATDVILVTVTEGKGRGFTVTGASYGDYGIRPINTTLPRDANIMTSAYGLVTAALDIEVPQEIASGPLEPAPVALPSATAVPAISGAAEEGEYLIDPNSPIFKDTGKKEEGRPIVKEWWFWVAVVGGAALVGGGITGIVLATRGGETGSATRDLKINLVGPR